MSTIVTSNSNPDPHPFAVGRDGEAILVGQRHPSWTLRLSRDEATALRDQLAEVLR